MQICSTHHFINEWYFPQNPLSLSKNRDVWFITVLCEEHFSYYTFLKDELFLNFKGANMTGCSDSTRLCNHFPQMFRLDVGHLC